MLPNMHFVASVFQCLFIFCLFIMRLKINTHTPPPTTTRTKREVMNLKETKGHGEYMGPFGGGKGMGK